MAQTKRKRRSKHRGTPAGTIEARGRTGRKPSPDEQAKLTRQQERRDRMMRPPSWKSAAFRSALAASLLLVFTQIGLGPDIPLEQSIAVAGAAFLIYIPLGFYTDRFLYRRRMARDTRLREEQRQQAQRERAEARAAKAKGTGGV